jgi:hypothetical protein
MVGDVDRIHAQGDIRISKPFGATVIQGPI